jgi:hypothetical protein
MTAINSRKYRMKREHLIKRLFFIFVVTTLTLNSHAEEELSIKSRLENKKIEVNLIDTGQDFYELDIKINGIRKIHNNELIPSKSVRNKGGLKIFRGAAIANEHLLLNFYFCSPDTAICLDRKIFINLLSETLDISREETIAFSGELAVRSVFFKSPPMPIKSINYKELLESNDLARNSFKKYYGSCLSSIAGDPISLIVNELESTAPKKWIFEKNCITPQLIMALLFQKELSTKAAERYLRKINF